MSDGKDSPKKTMLDENSFMNIDNKTVSTSIISSKSP